MIGQPSELSSLLKFFCKSFGTNLGWSLQALLQIGVTHCFGKLIWIGCQQSFHDKESVYIWHLSWMIANALNLWIVYFSLMRPFCVVLFSFLFHKLCGIKHSCSNTVKFLFKFHLKICMSPQNIISNAQVMVTFFIWKKWTSDLKTFFYIRT